MTGANPVTPRAPTAAIAAGVPEVRELETSLGCCGLVWCLEFRVEGSLGFLGVGG